MLGQDKSSSLWLALYFASSWTTEFGHGLCTTVVGPTQPYLAENTNVAIDVVNFVWTVGFFGFLLGSIITSFVFKRFVTSDRGKLIFLFTNVILSGVFVIILPFTTSFPVLVIARLGQYLFLGSFATADTSLIVYVLGPTVSRPFTMTLHALIGAGFLAGTFLVRPFLPGTGDIDKNSLCSRFENGTTTNSPGLDSHNITDSYETLNTSSILQHSEYYSVKILNIQAVAWPFIISGSWSILFSFGFLILAFLPYKMPRFYEDYEKESTVKGKNSGLEGVDNKLESWKDIQEREGNGHIQLEERREMREEVVGQATGEKKKMRKMEETVSETQIQYMPFFLVIVVLFYFCSCGIERTIQSMGSTFGLCGPLDLSPGEAVAIDSFYNGGFMCGRIVASFIAGLVSPRNMISVSLVFCVMSTIVLCSVAGYDVYGLYAGTCILGFFVSWQFGACYSWVAKHIDITGRIASIFFIGCGAGSLSTPPLSGFIFTSSLGPMSIVYLTLFLSVCQCCLYLSMWLMARHSRRKHQSGLMKQRDQKSV